MFDTKNEKLRMLALQAHQISGMLDPAIPLRTVVERSAGSRGALTLRDLDRLNHPEVGRLVNERLAPGGLN